MFHYFSNENLSEKNGTSATVSMKTWFLLMLVSLFNLIPVVGTIIWLIVYLIIGFKAETAPSVANYIKLNVLITIIVLVVGVVLSILGIGAFASILGSLG